MPLRKYKYMSALGMVQAEGIVCIGILPEFLDQMPINVA